MKIFNEYGEISPLDLLSWNLLLFSFFYICEVIFFGLYQNSEYLSSEKIFEILVLYYEYFFTNILNAYMSFTLSNDFLSQTGFFISIALIPAIIFTIFIRYFAKIQQKLASLQLEQYSLYFKQNNMYIFKLSASEKMDYNKFVSNFENALQLFNKGSLSISRFRSNMIKVQFKEITPTIEQLLKVNVLDYLKKEHIFLGFSGGIKSKITPEYIHINKLLHVGNFGTSSAGKSNTLNQILISLIHNFSNTDGSSSDLISKIIFVDFKGQIESSVYDLFEDEAHTKKIETLGDDREALLNRLRELNDINKNRMQILIKHKQKQYKKEYIFLMLDEVAEILLHNPKDKQDKELQNEIVSILESLFRTGRSQGFRIFVSTQSFVGNASGLTGQMKNNIKTKLLHLTQSPEALRSVFPEIEVLQKEGIDPSSFTQGEYVMATEGHSLVHARAIYIPEDTDEYIELLKRAL